MIRRPLDRVALGAEALRLLTADDGPVATITRARLLERHRGKGRRRLLAVASGAVVVTVSAALTAAMFARRTDAPALARPAAVATEPKLKAAFSPPVEIVPATPLPARPPADCELAAYGAAHAAHFAHKDPSRALRLWTAYLQGYPKGHFVPEATYNRALALVRLGRREQAVAALKPIAAGRFGDYRLQEAEALLGALTAK